MNAPIIPRKRMIQFLKSSCDIPSIVNEDIIGKNLKINIKWGAVKFSLPSFSKFFLGHLPKLDIGQKEAQEQITQTHHKSKLENSTQPDAQQDQ
jgi:hypothetical protein